jgi:hypothetical protein
MENYSPAMRALVRQQLRDAGPEHFALLLQYYRRRGGPGLVLAAAEAVVRGLNPDANTFPPACPECGEQRNRCLPFLLTTKGHVATISQ